MSQGTLDDFVEKKPAFRMSSGDKKKIDDDLALYLLQYNRTTNMVNDYHFKVWCNSLNPSYDVPCSQKVKSLQVELTKTVDEKISMSLSRTASFQSRRFAISLPISSVGCLD